MTAIARACAGGALRARIALVIADSAGIGALDAARALGIDTRTVAWEGGAARAQFERALGQTLESAQPDLIVLAGFMRVLSAPFVEARAERMLNIHPSLLPKFRGLHTHRRVLEAGERVHGASVHYVTPELDGGPVILQSRVAVRAGDTEEILSARVQSTEHIIYPRVIGWIADGRLAWREGRPWLDDTPLEAPIVEDFNAP